MPEDAVQPDRSESQRLSERIAELFAPVEELLRENVQSFERDDFIRQRSKVRHELKKLKEQLTQLAELDDQAYQEILSALEAVEQDAQARIDFITFDRNEEIRLLKENYRAFRERARKAMRMAREALDEQARRIAELERLLEPPLAYGTFLRINDDGTLDYLSQNGGRVRARYADGVDPEALRIGQRLVLTAPEGNVLAALDEFEELGVEMTVEEALPNGRLRLAGPQGDKVVMLQAESVLRDTIKAGDLVLALPRLGMVVEVLPRKERSEFQLEDIPDVTYAQIGGQHKALTQLRQYIEIPLFYPERCAAYGLLPTRGLLLEGPPGVGKTLSVQAVANALARDHRREVKLLAVRGPELLTMWVGETERKIREPFEIAQAMAQKGTLVFVFFDEVDSMFPTRGMRFGDAGVSENAVTQFATMLDGIEKVPNIFVIATTNRADLIDPALLRPGRLHPTVTFVRPDKQGVVEILKIYLTAELPLHPKYFDPHFADTDREDFKRYERECFGDPRLIAQMLIDAVAEKIFDEKYAETQLVATVEFTDSGERQHIYMKDLISGAVLKAIVDRAKMLAILEEDRLTKEKRQRCAKEHGKRCAEKACVEKVELGIKLKYLFEALDDEFKHGKNLPKYTDTQQWARILDLPVTRPFVVVATAGAEEEALSGRGHRFTD